MNVNDNDPKCEKCGKTADFGVENKTLGLPFTNYRHKCFAEDHPEIVKIKDKAIELAEEADEDGIISIVDTKYNGETFH